MRKIFFILLALLASTIAVQANPVLPAHARQKAQAFMQQKGRDIAPAIHRAPARPGTATVEEDGLSPSPYYVFNAQDSQGFVIISGDDRTDEVLGYADNGTFNEALIPDNMRAWLEYYAEIIECLDYEDNTASSVSQPLRVPTHSAVTPLVRTLWDQFEPYNNKCPVLKNQQTVTGCVATAMAQIMYFHKWPKTRVPAMDSYNFYNGTVPATTAATIDWSSMKLSYSGTETDASANAVATLMRLCGQSVETYYGSAEQGGSNASTSEVPFALKTIFNYDSNTQWVSRSNYTVVDWDRLIYNEISNQRPVLYSGHSSGQYASGHAFVIDGYDGKGYYHVNWGWGGDSNGYFKLHITNPENNTGIGASKDPDGYTFKQDAVIGIQPPTGQPVEKTSKLTSKELVFTGTTVTADFWNWSGERNSFYFGFGYLNSDGSVTCFDSYPISYDLDVNRGFSKNVIKTDVAEAGLADGDYNIVSCSKLATATRWECSCGTLVIQAKVRGGQVTLSYPKISLKAQSITFPWGNYTGIMQKVVAQVKNNGGEYYGPIYLFASTSNSKGNALNWANLAVEAGATEEVYVYFRPDSPGTYHIWLATDENGDNVIGESSLVILEAPECTLELVRYTQDPHIPVRLTATVKNTGDFAYMRELRGIIFPYVPNENVYSLDIDETKPLNLKPGETATYTFSFSKGLEVGKTCYLRLRYFPKQDSNEQKELFTGYPDVFDIQEGVATSIQDVQPSTLNSQDVYYTLEGRKLIGRPVQKGIYLQGGKKIIVP